MTYSSSIIVLTTLVLSLCLAQTVKYPLILWSETAFDQTTESSGAMHPHDVLDSIQNAIEASKPKNLLILVKDNFSSKELVINAKKFDNLKKLITTHASLYTNLRQPFDIETITTTFPQSKLYTVQQLSEIEILQQKLFTDLSQTSETLNVVMIEIKETVSIEDLDQVFKNVQEQVLAQNPQTLVVISGREGKDTERLLNLQQQSVTDSTTVQQATFQYPSLAYYTTPTIVTGLFVSAFIIFFLLFGFLQVFALQTPTYFAQNNIDFGKIEK